MKKLNIQLPKDMLALSELERNKILGVLAEAMRLPAVMPVTTGNGNEHNMWERNHDHMLADIEDALYEELLQPAQEMLANVFLALDLPTDGIDLQKAQDAAYIAFLDTGLLKSKNNGKTRISDLVKLNRDRVNTFMKYVQDKNPFKREELAKLDALMRTKLPNYAAIAEDFSIRAGFIGKIRNQAERENLKTIGAFVDRFPQTLQAVKYQGVVLTLREKEKAEAEGRTVHVLPLTPKEERAVHVATHHAGDKMQEISERHMAGVRQLVLRAQKERWSAQKLAQELFDAYGEQNRDWRRVAITELAMASNDAYLAGVEEGEQVVGMGSDTACKHCKQYVIGKTFTVTHQLPKNDYHHDMNMVWAGKSNYKRRVAEYVPCIPMHPLCRCRWHRLSRFYKVDSEGNFVLKDTAELIQEERAKRGMEPDPHLQVPGETETERLKRMSDEVLRKLQSQNE